VIWAFVALDAGASVSALVAITPVGRVAFT
jgi:hypothetical protein